MAYPELRKWAARRLLKSQGNNKGLTSFLASFPDHNRRTKASKRNYQPLLEMLEDRTLLSSPDQIEVRMLSLATNDLVYDPANQMIYASIPSSAGFGVGNSITAIDPVAGTIGNSVFVGSEPTKLAVSDNGQYVYVSLKGADAVARFNVPNQNVDVQFSLPTETFAEDLAAVPGSPQSVAVARLNPDFSPGGAGIAIYDNAVQRPKVAFPGDSIAFGSSTVLYAYDEESTAFQFVQMMVSNDGLTVTNSTGGLINQFNVTIKFDSGLIYTSNGKVIDPQALKLLGTYNASGSFVPDSAAGRTYFLSGGNLIVFDQATFTPIESFAAPGGGGDSLIRWGTNGLAYRTGNEIILINLVPLTATGVPVNAGEGTAFSGPVATITDNDQTHVASDFAATIDWGDGSTSSGVVTGSAGQFTVSGSHTYADEGSFPINVQIVPPNSASTIIATTTATITETDLSVNVAPFTTQEGQLFSNFVAIFSDSASPDDASAFDATILWGDGSSSTGTVFGSNGNFAVTGSHTYSDEGSFQFTVLITEAGSPSPAVSASGTASVSDADTLGAAATTISPTEGLLFAGPVASFSDTNTANSANDFTASKDWGDGGTSFGIISGSAGAFTVIGSHTYQEEGTYSVTITVTDDGSGTAMATAAGTANVGDAVLIAAGTPVHAAEGAPFSGQVATFTDTNPNATLGDFIFSPPGTLILATSHTVIDWGDGSPTSLGDVRQPGGIGSPFIVDGSHTYLVAGSYTIKVTIEDEGGSTAIANTTATVTDSIDIVGRVNETGQIWTGVSTGSSFTNSLEGSWNPAVTWVDVVAGDFNGDGRTDIAGRDLNSGNWWVAVSNGSSFTNSLWTNWNPNVTWVDVQVGDFTGDGKADIVGRVQETGQWWVAQSTGSSFTNSLWATWNPMATWADVKVGDFNGDGKADITGRYLQGGSWWTGISTGSSFTTSLWTVWSTAVTWVNMQVGDFNGDGKADITGRVQQSGEWWVAQSTGSSFSNALWATWNPNVTWVDVKVGDFNGDGSSDIIGRVLETGQWWVGLSNQVPLPPGFFHPLPAFATTLWSTWSTGVTWVDVQVGDFNGDGKSDITGRALQTGGWWTGISNGTTFTTNLWGTWSTAVNWVDVRSGDFA
jgi:hypothetical protein